MIIWQVRVHEGREQTTAGYTVVLIQMADEKHFRAAPEYIP